MARGARLNVLHAVRGQGRASGSARDPSLGRGRVGRLAPRAASADQAICVGDRRGIGRQIVIALAWFGCGVFLVVAMGLMLRAIDSEAESPAELRQALLAYAAPIPGGVVMGLATFGTSPPLLLVPGAVYLAILLVTRWRPLLLLGHVIERIDRKVSDRYVGIMFGVAVAAVFIGAFVKVAVFG